MKSPNLSLAHALAALVLSGAAFGVTAGQKRKPARAAATPAPETVAPAPAAAAKKNARPGDAQAQQQPPPGAARGDAAASPASASADETRYSFEFAQPEFLVSSYLIEHDSAGRARLSFRRKNDGLDAQPVVEPFDISPAAFARILAGWEALKFLDSQESYQADKQFPHLGTMRLGMRRGGRERRAEFNWTTHDRAEALVREYRGLAEQQLVVFDMALAREYQPSEAIKVLKRLEFLFERQQLSDASQLLPLLRDLSTDERIPLIARNHAERLIKKIEK